MHGSKILFFWCPDLPLKQYTVWKEHCKSLKVYEMPCIIGYSLIWMLTIIAPILFRPLFVIVINNNYFLKYFLFKSILKEYLFPYIFLKYDICRYNNFIVEKICSLYVYRAKPSS